MNYRFLDSFLVVAKHLNFSNAAHELRVTPAAITRQVKILEENFGAQLFVRSPKQVYLTKEGKDLLEQVSRFDLWAQSRFKEGRVQTIRLGVIAPLLVDFMPIVLKKIKKIRPLNFQIVNAAPSTLTEKLKSGELDACIYNKNIQTDILSSRKLFSEVATLISKNKVPVNEISKHPWVTVEAKDYIHNFAKSKKFDPPPQIIQVNSPVHQVRLVEQGLGVAIVSGFMVRKNKKLFSQPVKFFENEMMYLTTLNTRLIPYHMAEFTDLVISEAKKFR